MSAAAPARPSTIASTSMTNRGSRGGLPTALLSPPSASALAAMLEKQLHKLGLVRARVIAVATKAGQGADLRFKSIPAAKVDLLKKAIGR